MMDNIRELMDNGIHETQTAKNKEQIIDEFAQTINKYSLENDSNTPDFILARYLYDCLMAFHAGVCRRSVWFNPMDIWRQKNDRQSS